MLDDVGIRAAGFFEDIREHRQAVEGAFGVNRLSELQNGGSKPC